MSVLQQNHRDVRRVVEQTAEAAGRLVDAVKLVVVSKTFSADDTRRVYAIGQRGFGENYIQEWSEKTETLADLLDIVWHIIGDAQPNKIEFVAERVHWMHTIDRLKTARRLSE